MKSYKRVIMLTLAVVMVLTLSVIGVSAANTTNTEFTLRDVSMLQSKETAPRQKQDSSPVYLCIDASKTVCTHCQVSAIGSDSSGSKSVNLTLVEGKLVDYVICRSGVEYSIHARIYEDRYANALLMFSQLTYSVIGDICGKWSPDSTYRYVDAT